MAFLLGIDTGGTFTDAVILDDGAEPTDSVLAKAKSLTTRPDLSIGIAGAVKAVLEASHIATQDIALVSLSTTLATNALVEGQGDRVALIAIGFDERDMKKAGLDTALGNDPLVLLAGGHTTHGVEAMSLDLSALDRKLDDLDQSVSGFAIAGYFAVRNPAHEQAVADLIVRRTGKPVTCSHELSAKLNGPKRALTTLLNARLIPMIARLIAATRATLDDTAIAAPLMVVRGDGALVGADFARLRPIETILSGPAASLVGAHFLTGLHEAIVNDVGGTTSDVAILENGRPEIDPEGALVGGYRTMVEAVAMRTFGLGGDSDVSLSGSALNPMIALGPRRVVPISLLANNHPDIVCKALDLQCKSALPGRYDGRFALRLFDGDPAGLTASQQTVFSRLGEMPVALNDLLESHSHGAALSHLVSRGLVQISALTPSDALHALGEQEGWDSESALQALTLFGRKRDGGGRAFCTDPLELAERIVQRMRRLSADIILETAFASQGQAADLTHHPLVSTLLDEREASNTEAALVELSLSLNRPLIGLGASAYAWHPKAAELLGTRAVVPDHAGVANAVGAVVGQVSVSAQVTISQPAEGRFHVTETEQPFSSEASAFTEAESLARKNAEKLAVQAGAGDFDITVSREEKRADFEGRDMLVEAIVTARATGRPALSSA